MTNVVPDGGEAGGDQGGHSVGSTRYWVRAVERTVQLLTAVAEDAGRGKTLGEVARMARDARAERTSIPRNIDSARICGA